VRTGLRVHFVLHRRGSVSMTATGRERATMERALVSLVTRATTVPSFISTSCVPTIVLCEVAVSVDSVFARLDGSGPIVRFGRAQETATTMESATTELATVSRDGLVPSARSRNVPIVARITETVSMEHASAILDGRVWIAPSTLARMPAPTTVSATTGSVCVTKALPEPIVRCAGVTKIVPDTELVSMELVRAIPLGLVLRATNFPAPTIVQQRGHAKRWMACCNASACRVGRVQIALRKWPLVSALTFRLSKHPRRLWTSRTLRFQSGNIGEVTQRSEMCHYEECVERKLGLVMSRPGCDCFQAFEFDV